MNTFENETYKIEVVSTSPKSLDLEFLDKLTNKFYTGKIVQDHLPRNVKYSIDLLQFKDALLRQNMNKIVVCNIMVETEVIIKFNVGIGLAKTEFRIKLDRDFTVKSVPLAVLPPQVSVDEKIIVFRKISDFKISYSELIEFGIEYGILTRFYAEKEFKLEDMTFDPDVYEHLKNQEGNGKPVLKGKRSALNLAARFLIPIKQVVLTHKEMIYLDHHYPKMFDMNGIMTRGYHFNDGTVKFKELKKCRKQILRIGGNYHPRLDKSDHYVEKGWIFLNLVKSFIHSKGYNFIHSINGVEKTILIDEKLYYVFEKNQKSYYNVYIPILSDPSVRFISTLNLTLILEDTIKTNSKGMIYVKYSKKIDF